MFTFEMAVKMLTFCFRWRMFGLPASVLLLLCYTLSCVGQQCTDNIVCQTPSLNLTSSSVSVTVSSTCGDPNTTIYASADSSSTAMCTLGMHRKELMLDTSSTTFGNLTFSNPIMNTYWQSENSISFVNGTAKTEFVMLNFTDIYLINSIVMVFASPGVDQSSKADMRPRAMQILSWDDATNDWMPWRLYADNCAFRYPFSLVDRPPGSNNDPLATLCMEKFYSGDDTTLSGYGYGLLEVSFSPASDFTSDYNSRPDVQRRFMTSAIQLKFDYPAKDIPNLSYYAIAALSVSFQCACFGHASACTQGRCDCKHNTMGVHCDQCLPTFNDRPWQMGVVSENASLFICQDCNCNKHSASCRYDSFFGYGICENCTNNTAGEKCESCALHFYVNPNWNDTKPYAPCTGIATDPLQPLTYNCYERCIPCNCSSVGTDPGLQLTCEGISGNCTCKANVEGRACDTCKAGTWSLGSDAFFGCRGCDCEPSGSLYSISYCDRFNGTCICKNYTEGVRCERCKDGYFDLDITKPDGCTPCDCDVGASQSLSCPAFGGACTCKPFISGRTCRDPFPSYFGAVLDYLTFDAEFTANMTPGDIVERYGAGDLNATNTGRGFVNLVAPRSLSMSLTVPFTSLFSLIIRYETPATWSGVQTIVQLHDPTTGPTAPYNCGTNTTYLATAVQQRTANIPPKAVAGAVDVGTVCLLANLPYDLRLNFLSSTPPAASILVDSVVLIPDFGTGNAYLLSNDSAKAQMVQCSRAQQSIDMSSAQNLSCPQLGYSIMVDKFTRAYDCACNMTGSLGTACEAIGGQCECKPNVFLRDCSQCKVNSYGFQSGVGCTECNCHPNGSLVSACSENGTCSCRTNVIGDKCDVCIPQYWGVFTGKGCQPCVCNMIYALDMNCSDSGQCNCLPGVGGIQCDRCANGYYRLTASGCTSCGCSYYGSQTINCDQSDGHCTCKAQTVGNQCATCKEGYFGLGPWGDEGCIKCFCSGHSNVCMSAFGWYVAVVETRLNLINGEVIRTNEWTGADPVGNPVLITNPTFLGQDGTAVRLMTISNDFNGTQFYFVAPAAYLGDKRTAYGQHLNISLILSFPPTNVSLVPVAANGDVFLEGNYTSYTLVASFPVQPTSTAPSTYSLHLHESIWYLNSSTSLTKVQATYENLMQVLASISSIKVRATFFRPTVFLNDSNLLGTNLIATSLTYASDVAPTSGGQELVNNVEECVCPPEYQGQFCEFCATGFTRLRPAAGAFSPCVRCFCNNHQIEGTTCDTETGACNCTDNTNGTQCELCFDGYFGYPASGRPDSCQPCMCPGNVIARAVNTFAKTCHNDGLGGSVCDNCTGGTNGTHCESCGDGYYGTPTNITNNNGTCSPCFCNGNAWYNQSCNSTTGTCDNCIFDTIGRNCELCKPNYWGSGVFRNCKPCNCNSSIGRTGDCDKATSICLCKENITSSQPSIGNCDTCLAGYFNWSSGNGCQPCNCFPSGSLSATSCDVNGTCYCTDRYMGRQCDTCKNGTWNPLGGCTDCECLNGSRSRVCDSATGQCPCNPGFTGRQCNLCEAGKNASLPYIGNLILGVYPNCIACGTCYDHIASIVSQLGVDMETSYQQIMSLWWTSFNNMSNDSVTAQVTLIEANLNTTLDHVDAINDWLPLFKEVKGNFSVISTNFTYYSRSVQTYNAITNVFLIWLNEVMSWTGTTEVAPGISKSSADLAQDLQTFKVTQDSTFNLSSTTYQNIVIRIGIISNVNGTISSLQARVRNALQNVQNSRNLRSQAGALLNSLSTAANEATLTQIFYGVDAVQNIRTNAQRLVTDASYYLDQANSALQQLTNWSLTTEGTLYNQIRDAQSLGSNATVAQRSANTSVAAVSSFMNLAASAKQLISGNVVSLADALRTIALDRSILDSVYQIANNVGSMSLDALQSRVTDLTQQIRSTNIPMDKVISINNLATQSLQLASAAQNATQQALAKTQNVLSLLSTIESNRTGAETNQQVAQAGLTNATTTINNINSIVTMVTQKAADAQTVANQTNDAISSSVNAMYNLQQIYPTLTQRFRVARLAGEFANQTAFTAASRSAGNVNASNILQSNINAKSSLLSQQKTTLLNIQADLDSIRNDLSILSNTYNLLGTRDEAVQQSKDIYAMTSDLINMSAQLDRLQQQIDSFPPNSTYCNI